jgi:hypothetical protein
MSHTPGPWENDGNDIWAGDHLIATVSGDQNGLFANPSRLADSALIAAAPELLDALRDALDVMGDWGEDGDPEWANVARAAIAKAEGKVPENT